MRKGIRRFPLIAALLLFPMPAAAQTFSTFAPADNAVGLAFGPPPGSFDPAARQAFSDGTVLYVGQYHPVNAISYIAADGARTPLATGVSRAGFLAFGPPPDSFDPAAQQAFSDGTVLYVSNVAGTSNSISYVEEDGDITLFSTAFDTTSGIAFGFPPTGSPCTSTFADGRVLYAANISAKNMGTVRLIDRAGAVCQELGPASGIDVPYGLAYDAQGNSLYIANLLGSVGRIASDGAISVFSPATYFDQPRGLALGPPPPPSSCTPVSGNDVLYAADPGDNTVKVLQADGSVCQTLTAAAFNGVRGAVFDAAGYLFVANIAGNTISRSDISFAPAPTPIETVSPAAPYTLAAPYPNPFTWGTTFTLHVARPQHVDVAVYNLLGQRVAVLHNGLLGAGETHTFVFEPAHLPGGLYLLRATGEQFTAAQRLTLLR